MVGGGGIICTFLGDSLRSTNYSLLSPRTSLLTLPAPLFPPSIHQHANQKPRLNTLLPDLKTGALSDRSAHVDIIISFLVRLRLVERNVSQLSLSGSTAFQRHRAKPAPSVSGLLNSCHVLIIHRMNSVSKLTNCFSIEQLCTHSSELPKTAASGTRCWSPPSQISGGVWRRILVRAPIMVGEATTLFLRYVESRVHWRVHRFLE